MIELTTPAAQQTIQAILTPALMISACGLLLLGLNNRYVSVANRIRTLNDEKRRRLSDPDAIDREYVDALRFESVMRQIPSLFKRVHYLRLSLVYLWCGVICYLSTSLLLATSLFVYRDVASISVWVFLLGLLFALIGVVYALLDIVLAEKVLRYETEIY
jgi:hypothetical protein